MNATRRSLAALGFIVLSGCSATQVESVTAKVGAVCAQVTPLASAAMMLPTVGPFIAAGVWAGCATDSGIAKLAADPSSLTWLAQQATMLQSALGR